MKAESRKQSQTRSKRTLQSDQKRTLEQSKLKKRQQRAGNRQILVVTYCVVIVFLGMIAYIGHFVLNDSQKIINNSYNKRQDLLAQRIIRGNILSADGKVLAYTQPASIGKDVRKYPYGRKFCHVVGRTINSKTGIEEAQSFTLLTSHSNPVKQILNQIKGQKNQGDSVVTTLNARLQQTAWEALGNRKGAVVALEPSTGKVLAMVSKPDYNPNRVSENWSSLIDDTTGNSPLLNRATQGLYPPGSTFKVLTAMEYMMEHEDYKSYRYVCNGTENIEGNKIQCYDREQHGRVNVKRSLAKSCNCSFANMAMNMNMNSLHQLCEKFRFNKTLPVDFEYSKSKFSLTAKSSTGEKMQTSIGQGKTMISPLENALISATIANKGTMMKPYVVDHVENDDKHIVTQYDPEKTGKIISEKNADKMKNMMKSVVSDGTASSLRSLSYPVAGKTGSAEVDSQGTTHAWFVGIAPAKNPKIVVSIIVEGAGTGSQYAVPIAKQMLQSYLGE